jgi:spore coat polysaccharide biosynthesis protein SpsF (cytidylyltransferase family)
MKDSRKSSNVSVASSQADGRSSFVPKFKTEKERNEFRGSLLDDLKRYLQVTSKGRK